MDTAFHLPIIRAAWRIAWRERRVWVFALLAGLIIGSGIGNALMQIYGVDVTDGWWGYGEGMAGSIGGLWVQARATGVGATAALGALGALIIASVAVVIWAVVVSVAAIVIGAEPLARGATAPTGLGKRAIASAWPVFVVLLAMRVGIFLAMTIWRAALLWQIKSPTTPVIAIGIITFITLVVVISILHITTPFAVMNVVIDRARPLRAIREALALIRDRWPIIIESSCVLTIANAIGVIVWIAGSFILALPFVFLVGIGSIKGMPWLTMASFAVGGIVLAIFTVILSMIVTTFIVSAWTMVYLRLTGSGEAPEPWLHRALSRKP